MELKDIRPTVKNKTRKRVGRGPGSGHGKTSCRGHKGAKARSGRFWYIGMDGGNVPFYRKLPKRGFTSTKPDAQIVNLKDIEERFDSGAQVDPQALFEKNLIKNPMVPVKILAKGILTKKINVTAHLFSEKARIVIEEKGGKAECLNQ